MVVCHTVVVITGVLVIIAGDVSSALVIKNTVELECGCMDGVTDMHGHGEKNMSKRSLPVGDTLVSTHWDWDGGAGAGAG